MFCNSPILNVLSIFVIFTEHHVVVRKMYSAVQIAHLFVQKGISEEKPLTHMKLQKLVYFSHGLHLAAFDGKPLIIDSIEAWQYGPVIPSIYEKYAIFRDQLIVDKDKLQEIGFYIEDLPVLNENAEEIFNVTWDIVGDRSAIQLSNWTHEPNLAWSKVYRPGIPHIDIPNELIADDFKQFVEAKAS